MASRDKRKKKLRAKQSTRELIILEAERLIADKGVDGLRLSEIADLVGIQRPSIYTHFSGRSGVLTQVISRAITDMSSDFQIDEDHEPLDNIRKGARALTLRLVAHPAHVRILLLDFSSPTGLPEFTKKFGPPGTLEETGILRPVIDRIASIFAKGVHEKSLREYNSLDFFHVLLSVITGRIALDQRKIGTKSSRSALAKELEESIDDLCIRLLKR